MPRRIQAVKGTRDLLPPESARWSGVERTAREVFSAYGYQEIRTPILEDTDLFVRSVGETTDIVGKQMYTFADRKGRSLTLRPESTASVVRAFIQHGMVNRPLPAKLYYIGPHFRYERPQKGRYRQFHQIGAELIGDPGPEGDAELILMLLRFLSALDFVELVVQLNTVGDEASRRGYREALRTYFEPHRKELGEDSRRRLDDNPLRILDSKDPAEQLLLAEAPVLVDYLSPESLEHFEAVQRDLDRFNVAFRIEPRLVRGLDYYTRTVFEIVSQGLGAQDAIVGGGRYDSLAADLGGGDLPAIGFAIGEDRLLEVLPESAVCRFEAVSPVAIVAVGNVAPLEALAVAEQLRSLGVVAIAELTDRAVGAALKLADRSGARYVVLLGEEELGSESLTLKDLATGEQSTLPRSEVMSRLKGLV